MDKFYLSMYLNLKHFELIQSRQQIYSQFNVLTKDNPSNIEHIKTDDLLGDDFIKIHNTFNEFHRNDKKTKSIDLHKINFNNSNTSHELNSSSEDISQNSTSDVVNHDYCSEKRKTNELFYLKDSNVSTGPTVNNCQKHTDFSIERILSRDDGYKISDGDTTVDSHDSNEFDWLKCTRYKPPKLHRLRKRDAPKKRTLGCNPRIPFSETTLKLMETKYQENPYITGENLKQFAKTINVSKERIVVWFQNRRARQRREDESYRSAKSY